MGIDVAACFHQGAIGAIGSVPGTICAHPFDVLKIHMQTTDRGTHMQAARLILTKRGVPGFYRGLFPALEQRFVARGPMFLVSEVCTQTLELYTPLHDLQARGVGSCMSGYIVGFLQAVPEYRKKLLSQGVTTVAETRWFSLWNSARTAGLLRTGLHRRLHAAAMCCAVFDSTFFFMRDVLMARDGFAPPIAYGCAAATAVIVAYPLDTAVSKMLVVPPSKPVLPFRHNLSMNRAAFRGIPARGAEFFVSYAATGLIAMYMQL
eukprot:TRINITY_DN109532_c0_g1_i1.p1 TRINITY_DN109532_c0_g1~~TRINITY_DN109532_c0_g1_i1.p1  ORF type:complete len:263 (-),score=24.77 TRINITY_DN109532_c0_g1_i1:56-844(-)